MWGGQVPNRAIRWDSPIRRNVLYEDLTRQPDPEYFSRFPDLGGDLGCLRLNVYSSARVGSRYTRLPGPGNVFWLPKKSGKKFQGTEMKMKETHDKMRTGQVFSWWKLTRF